MRKTSKDIIAEFIKGATDGISGSNSNPGNLKIRGDQIIHYSTPILEREGEKYILNMTRYSVPTGRVQKCIQEALESSSYRMVLRVPRDYKGSLKDFEIL